MTDTLQLKQHDTAPAFRAQLLDGTTPLNLSTATTVRFLMRSRRGDVILTGTMVVEDQTANPGWVHRAWGTTDLATPGSYRAEVEVTWGDGKVQTFPPDGYAGIIVTPDLG